ncbi:MAG: hypothetical protein AB7F22_34840 [Reyranella sp.]|uniref:hypothetical protein n=1 Tax=Reyranella sp. TaxID=1929291 RepID=UPI003D0C03A9
MPPRRERVWPGLLGRYLVLVVVLGLIATSAYAAFDADDRPVVVRLAVAAFVMVVLIHIHSHWRAALDWAPPSSFEQARRPEPVEPKVASVLVRLQRQVEHGVGSRRFFSEVLWPRLVQLGEERGTRSRLPDEPPLGRWRKRGPSLAVIAELVRRVAGER